MVVLAALALVAFALLRMRGRGFLAERRRLREERKLEQQETPRRPRVPRRAKVTPGMPEPDAEAAQAEEEAASLYARSYIEWLDKQ